MVEVLRIICNEQLLTCLGQYDALPTCEVQYYTSTLTKTLTRLELRREFSLRNKKKHQIINHINSEISNFFLGRCWRN